MPKVIKRLAEMQVRNATPQDKDYKLYDGDGLCLLVRKTGTRVWQYPYKFASKRTVYTIGKYLGKNVAGHVGLQDAREACREIRALIEQGINPNEHKKAQISGIARNKDNTFEVLGREWHGKGTWVPKHAKNILRSLEADVFTYIGQKDVTDITRHDIIDILSRVEDRNAMYVAKRISKRCEDIFDYAIIKGLCENNPALGSSRYIKLPKATPRPHLKESELPEFLNKLSDYHGRNYIRMAMQLLVLTFLRPGELRNLRWSDVDEDNAIILIPKERMKMNRDHSVPLSKQALALIQKLRGITGNSELLFPSVKSHQQPISDVTLTKVLQILGYVGNKKIVPHGFRHTASTILNEHGFNSDHIERQLAHVETNKVRGAYNHAEYLSQRTEMMQWWADYLGQNRNRND